MSEEPEDTRDALDTTPQQALEEALQRILDPKHRPPDKALILLLWDENNYDMGFHCAGMKVSEMIALCEVHKRTCLNMMFDVEDDHPHAEDRP